MKFPQRFIAAHQEFCSFEKHVPAPCLRRSFVLGAVPRSAVLTITGLGFYDAFVNGKRVTKGWLAPYISAPDDLVYYDRYNVMPLLRAGENVLALVLGNGMQNAFGGFRWEFDKAPWRGAPKTALRLETEMPGGISFSLESDERFRTAPSPIVFDEMRCGEYYDARREQPGWKLPGFDDGAWACAVKAPAPKGEPSWCGAEPITVYGELSPAAITRQEDGYLYDFGVNTAGVCRLKLRGERGQIVTLEHGEWLKDGRLRLDNIAFVPKGYVQKDIYICAGTGEETFVPRFTYHGFRYVYVTGITPEQATPSLLTCLELSSRLEERGGFRCSDETANAIQQIVRRSTRSNFYYFPTDCPHREKNGWTGDAALSAEHMILNLSVENSLKEWLRNLCKAQRPDGSLPGVVPTGGWGYEWGNGPAWDAALIELPFQIYRYRGDKDVLRLTADSISRYLRYLAGRRDPDGLVGFGLGDWCPPGRGANQYRAPIRLTDSITALSLCRKASKLFAVLGMKTRAAFAAELAENFRRAVRFHLMDRTTVTAAGNCQTSQAMALYYGVFEPDEEQCALRVLLGQIAAAGDRMDTGVLGARVLFHVLSDRGYADLAFELITDPKWPSYGNMIAQGATSLWETFWDGKGGPSSLNHHFFGDISHWLISEVGGIHVNPEANDPNRLVIKPHFIRRLKSASSFHRIPAGRVAVRWERGGAGTVRLELEVPEGAIGSVRLADGAHFDDGSRSRPLPPGKTEFACTI